MKTKEIIKGYKGFDKDLKCIGFQYKEGEIYETDKKPVRCTKNGFHLCENPLDTWIYYPLNSGNKYHSVEGSGDVSRAENEDSKVAVQKIKINAVVSLFDMIRIGVDIILKKVKATTGDFAHAATTGYSAHAATTGNSAHAATTGDFAHAATTGDSAHAATTGDNTISAGIGINNKAKASLGSWIVLSEYDDNYILKCVKTVRVDGKKILPDTWYMLKNRQFIKSE
jgi:hypothetical protein